MTYVNQDTRGKYLTAKNGDKLYLRNQAKFVPIDYSKPASSRPGIAQAPIKLADRPLPTATSHHPDMNSDGGLDTYGPAPTV